VIIKNYPWEETTPIWMRCYWQVKIRKSQLYQCIKISNRTLLLETLWIQKSNSKISFNRVWFQDKTQTWVIIKTRLLSRDNLKTLLLKLSVQNETKVLINTDGNINRLKMLLIETINPKTFQYQWRRPIWWHLLTWATLTITLMTNIKTWWWTKMVNTWLKMILQVPFNLMK